MQTNKIYVKRLTGEILDIYTDNDLTIESLSNELMLQHSNTFKTQYKFLFHFYRRSEKDGDIEYTELLLRDKVKQGEVIDLIVNLPSHILIYCDQKHNLPWYKEIKGQREGPFEELFSFFTEEELEELCNPYSIENQQLIIDYDSLRYYFEPSESDPPEYVFTNEFVTDNLRIKFLPPSLDDYIKEFGYI